MIRFWRRRARGREPGLAGETWPGPPEPLPGSSRRRDGDVWTDALVEYTQPLPEVAPEVQTALLTTPAQHYRANGGRPWWT